MKVFLVIVSIIVFFVLVFVGIGYLVVVKSVDGVVKEFKKPSKKSYVLRDLDIKNGDLALVIIDRERKSHLIEDDDLIRQHQEKLRMTRSLLSFLPGHVNKESGIFVFKDRKLIYKKSFRLLKDFEVGSLLDNSLPVQFKSEHGTPSEMKRLVKELSKEEGVYVSHNGFEDQGLREPGKDYVARVFGKSFLVKNDESASKQKEIDNHFESVLRTQLGESLVQTENLRGTVSYDRFPEKVPGGQPTHQGIGYKIYTPSIEIYGRQSELKISESKKNALLVELNKIKDHTLNGLIIDKTELSDERVQLVIEECKNSKARFSPPQKRDVYVSYYKRGLE